MLFSGIVGFGNSLLYTILYTYYDLTSSILFYSRAMLLTAVIFLGINNIFLIYLQYYSFREILNRKIVIVLVLLIFSLFFLSILIPQISTFFEIKEVAFTDLIISFCFCIIGSMIIALVLKRFKLLHLSWGDFR